MSVNHNAGLYRGSILLAFFTLLLVAAGGLVISGSPVVTGVILWISLRILLHYAENAELRIASISLPGITFCQVFLGTAAFMSRIAYADAVQRCR